MSYPDNYVKVTRLLKTLFWFTDICNKPSYKNATSSLNATSYFCLFFYNSLHYKTRNCFFAQAKRRIHERLTVHYYQPQFDVHLFFILVKESIILSAPYYSELTNHQAANPITHNKHIL